MGLKIGHSPAGQRWVDEVQDRLDRIDARGQFFQNPVDAFRVAPDASGQGVQISFRLQTLQGLDSVAVLRNYSRDLGSATVLQFWPANLLREQQALAFTDPASPPAGQAAYYWVEAFPLNNSLRPFFTGPLTASAAVSTGPPGALLDFDASHSAGVGGVVTISVSFKPPMNGNFGSCKVYISGYQGNAGYVAVAQSASSPFQFTLAQTGESVTLKGVAVNQQGLEQPTGNPTKALTLNGTLTVPARIVDGTASVLTTGVQLDWTGSVESDVTQFLIYRGPRGGGFGAASQIATVAAGTGGEHMSYLDTSGLTGRFEWFIVADGGAGDSSPSESIQRPDVITSASLPPNVPANNTNYATVDSLDAGGDATIRIYGSGGVGSSWTRPTGFGVETYVAGTITGLAYATLYYVMWNGAAYVALTSFPDTLPDGYTFAGKLTTVAGGGGGGTVGGGGVLGDTDGRYSNQL